MSAKTYTLAVVVLLSPGVNTGLYAADAKQELAAKARAVLKTHCYRCHGQDGSVEGAMNYVADLGKLVARKKVIPGNADSSRLFKRVDDGTMPPPDEMPRPSDAEITLLRKWIEQGAPGGETGPPRTPITSGDVLNHVLSDLETIDRRARRFQRYFTLSHLYNAGLSDEELQTYRNALSKLVNSLSWNSRISMPVAVDPAKTVLRIDLRWYQWDATIWNRILQEYPYGILDDTTAARAVMVGTASKLPLIRADWFVGTASRPPLYYDVLQIPGTLTDLERQLRVDVVQNIQQERVMRIGFNGSGISRFNRILERHDSAQGMYWRTYDFDEPPANLIDRANGNLLPDRRNIFAFPLGPGLVEQPFQHAGGEAIFALPNGLHAYMLVKGDNSRIDKGPIAIVSDPKRPDRAVEPGVSCMSCHVTGILTKADQIRDHLDKNPKAFSRSDADQIRAIYPPKEKSLARMQEDAKKYTEVVTKTGAKPSKFEAVGTITLKYEADLDLTLAAAEVGMKPEEFRDRISHSESLTKHIGALRPAGGTVSRQIWVQAFGDIVRELQLGGLYQSNLNGPTLPDNTGELDPLESRDGVNAFAFSLDGRRALIASGDRSVRLYEVEGRRDLKRFIGHTGSVWAVAFSADGRLAVSGSMDGTARVWDVGTGRELKKFAGHDSLVTAVGFDAAGRWAFSGGFDGTVVAWKVGTGEELWRAEKLGYVTALVVDPENRFVLVAAGRKVRAYRLATGQLIHETDELPAVVSSLTISPDGKWFAAGDDAGGVHAWRVTGWRYWFHQTGHAGPVRAVAIKDGGRWMLSGGSDRTVRLWNTTDVAKEVATFRKHSSPLVGAAFLSNGTQTLSGDRSLGVLPWKIDRFLTAAPPKPPAEIAPAPRLSLPKIPYVK